MSKPGPVTQLREHRERLLPSVVAFFDDLIAGRPIPVRDAQGRITEWVQPTFDQRQDGAKAILGKLMPNLQASQVDVTSGGEGIVQLVLGSAVLPGGGQVIEHQDEDGGGVNAGPQGIEHHQVLDPAPIPDEGGAAEDGEAEDTLSSPASPTELPPEAPSHAKMRTRRRRNDQ